MRQQQLGISEHEILANYPSLRAEDLFNVWNYYRGHKNEINTLIKENKRIVLSFNCKDFTES